MSNLVKRYELAVDRDDQPFIPPTDAAYFRPYLLTGGRPLLMRHEDGSEKLVPLDATHAEFEQLMNYGDGLYRLIMIDLDENPVRGPTAYAEIGRGVFADQPRSEESDRMMRLCERIAQSNEQKDVLVADMNRTLMQTHVQLQQGAVALLEAASGTIRVANGIEAIERHPPVLDVDALSESVIEALDARRPEKPVQPPAHWVVQVLHGPVGMAALKLVNDFAETVKRAYAAKERGE